MQVTEEAIGMDESPLLVYTVGYQGHTIESFVELLQQHGIQQIIDVRQRPQSRKPAFNKKRLAEHLAAVGIGYVHMVALGTPKELRDEVRRNHDYPAFFAVMEAVIAAQPEALQEALDVARGARSALLCFEAQAVECHRSTVAQAMARHAGPAGMRVVNI